VDEAFVYLLPDLLAEALPSGCGVFLNVPQGADYRNYVWHRISQFNATWAADSVVGVDRRQVGVESEEASL
jgi:hypothetical protein